MAEQTDPIKLISRRYLPYFISCRIRKLSLLQRTLQIINIGEDVQNIIENYIFTTLDQINSTSWNVI